MQVHYKQSDTKYLQRELQSEGYDESYPINQHEDDVINNCNLIHVGERKTLHRF